MAEIRSTMDLVLERAAQMGKASDNELEQEEAEKKGMQLAARYLDGGEDNPAALLEQEQPSLQVAIRKGMAETLLRNLFLPRDEHAQQRTERAARGLIDLAAGGGDIVTICRELQHIIGQYRQHREQLRGQLEEQVRMQYEQVMASQGAGMSDELKIDPTRQPKFQEEWARLEAELDGQYNQALEQYRNQLRQRLGIV